MAVITISRQFGSGGDEIAQAICKNTGFNLFDKHLFARAAFEFGLADQEFVDYCEDSYRMKNFFERLFRPDRPVAQVRIWKETPDGVRTIEEIQLNEDHALACVRKAVQIAYESGNYVIVGRGGQALLKDKPGVLHVRVEAPMEDRLMRVRHTPPISERVFSDAAEERRVTLKFIESNDAASASYLKRFYSIDWADLQHYHLVVNTSKLSIEAAAKLVIQACDLV